MGVSLFLAHRLSLSSGSGKSSPAVKVAVTAVALSLAVMACAVAIVMGFKNEITSKVAGFNSQMTLAVHQQASDNPDPQANIITLTPTLSKILDEQPFITEYSLQISIPAIFKTGSDFKGVYLKSLSGPDLEGFIKSSLEEGEIPDFKNDSSINDILISRQAAKRLNLKVSDNIDTYFISDQVKARKLKVAGIFNSHFESYDDAFAYGSPELIQGLGGLNKNQGTSLSISTDNFANVSQYASELQDRLIADYTAGMIYKLYRVNTALDSGASYFSWLELLDTNVIVIIVLMTIVACVTLVSGMLILMVDKIRFIALMSALGASRRRISRIFVLLAAKIALVGMATGNVLALFIIVIQSKTHILPLDPESYYIDFVPMEISTPSILILNLAVFSIIWLILIIPSRFAGKAAPARTLAAE